MRPIQRLLKSTLSFGGTGTFDQGPFWSRPSMSWATTGDEEKIDNNFVGYVEGAYKANGIVFACILVRAQAFSEARFQYQRLINGRPGDLFGAASLELLEHPWRNGTTGELLWRMEQDVSLGGNFFAVERGDGQPVDLGGSRRIRRLRPDWVTILTGSPSDDPFDIDAEVIGYVYAPKGNLGRSEPTILTPGECLHFSPIPDPEAQWRGMSWLTPVVRQVKGHNAAATHKIKFFENGATFNTILSYDASLSPDQFEKSVAAFREAHEGVDKAYKTVHVGGGADVNTVSADMRQLDFKASQGSDETAIAAAAGAHPVVVGLAEGLSGSSLNAGNFDAALRRFADLTVRPNWRSAAAALTKFAPIPDGSEGRVRLWYDDRDIPFLRADSKKSAEINQIQASTIGGLVREGFTPESAVASVVNEDPNLLVHTGKMSVQLQEPGTQPKSLRQVVRDSNGRLVGVEN